MSDETRRGFLSHSTAIATMVGLGSSIAGAAEKTTPRLEGVAGPEPRPIDPDKPLRLAFIGVGGRGHNLLDSVLKEKNIKIQAIAELEKKNSDLALDKIKKTFNQLPDLYNGETDYKYKLLAREDIDAVLIAVPCDLHGPMYLDCFAAGRHFYGEKPMCIDAAEADALLQAQKRNPHVIAQIGFQRRASQRYQQSIKAIRDGAIGIPTEARVALNNEWGPLGLPTEGSRVWYGRRRRSGDWMLEQACHTWDVLCWVAEAMPVAAHGFGRQDVFTHLDPKRDVTDYYIAQLEFPNNFYVDFQQSWFCPRKAGSRFAAWYERVAGPKGGVAIDEGRIFPRDPEGKEIVLPGEGGDFTDVSVQGFLNSLRTGAPLFSGIRNGYMATMTGLLVRKAIYEKRRVLMKELTT